MRKSECFTERGLNFTISPETKLSLDDLDMSLSVNKQLFLDALSTKKNSLEEENSKVLVSSRILAEIESENDRLLESINRMMIETVNGESSIKIADDRTKNSRRRKKEISIRYENEVKDLREKIVIKEEEIRSTEKYLAGITEVLHKYMKEEKFDVLQLLKKGKEILFDLKRRTKYSEFLHGSEKEKCQNIDCQIKELKKNLKVSSPKTKSLDKVLKKNFLINTNFCNYLSAFDQRCYDESSEENNETGSILYDITRSNRTLQEHIEKPVSAKEQELFQLSSLELALQITNDEISILERTLSDLQYKEITLKNIPSYDIL